MMKIRALAFFACLPLLLAFAGQSGSCGGGGGGNASRASQNDGPVPAQRASKQNGNVNSNDSANSNGNVNSNTKDGGTAKGEMSNKREESKSEEKAGRVPAGTWGGEHVRIEVTADGATVEFDCARGQIGAPLEIGGDGSFNLRGTFKREGPGPIRLKMPRPTLSARYAGKLSGDEMTLTVTLTDTSENAGTFTLRRGSEGHIRKCR